MDPALAELDFTGGLTEAEAANLKLLDAWDSLEAEATRALSESVSGTPDGTSILSKVVQLAPDIPAGRQIDATTFCGLTPDGRAMNVGVRLKSRDRPTEAAVHVVLAMLEGDEYTPVDDRVSVEDAMTLGNLIIGKIEWAREHGVQLTPNCAEIILPAPLEPAASEA
jgi:hypothetical protein